MRKPFTKYHTFFALSLPLLFSPSCTNTGESAGLPSHAEASPDAGQTGVSIPIKGVFNHQDSIEKPVANPVGGEPRVIPLATSSVAAGNPEILPLPGELPTFTPGQDGVPLPKVHTVEGTEIPARIPQPIPAPKLEYADDPEVVIQSMELGLEPEADAVNDILEDSRGYVWFATNAGLIRYEGQSLVQFTTNEGLPSDIIRQILQDSRGNLWLGTGNTGELIRYDGHSFTIFNLTWEKRGVIIYSMLEDKQGYLWIGTTYGVIRFRPPEKGASAQWIRFTKEHGLSDESILSLFQDSRGGLWLGTVLGGANRYDGRSFTQFPVRGDNALISSIIEDGEGHIWLGAYQSLIKYDGSNFIYYTPGEGLPGHFVKNLLLDGQGHIWLSAGTQFKEGSLSRFDISRWGEGNWGVFTHYTENEGLRPGFLNCIVQDRQGHLWLGFRGGGVGRLKRQDFTHYSEEEGLNYVQSISSIMETRQGELLLTTWGNGVIGFDGRSFYEHQEFPKNLTNVILEGSKGELWIDNAEKGISLVHRKAQGKENKIGDSISVFFQKKGLFNDKTYPCLIDSKGHLWTKTNGLGVSRYDGERFLHFPLPGLEGAGISDLKESREGTYWIATKGRGIYRLFPANGENRSIFRYTTKEGLPNDHVNTLLEDSRGTLWIGSPDGLSYLRPGADTFFHFTEKEGFGKKRVFGMVEDRQGNIWVARYAGLSVVMPPSDSVPGFRILHFGKNDGVWGKFLRALYLDQANFLWVGGDQGLNRLDLNSFRFPSRAPAIFLNHIEANSQYVDFAQQGKAVVPFFNYPLELRLPYQQNKLTFHFSAIDWAEPDRIRYSYILEDMEDQWSPPAANSIIYLQNLPPGRHTLRVRAKGSAEIWSEPFEYSFAILPPWYRTWWASFLWIALAVGGVYQLYRFLLRRQLAIAEAQRLKELDAVKTKLYANISHEFRTPLTVILGNADMLEKMVPKTGKDLLARIRHNGKTLLNLVNQLLDLTKLESGRMKMNMIQSDVVLFAKYLLESFHSLAEQKKIHLRFQSGEESFWMDYDPEKLRQVLSNLLSNAIRFTPEGGEVTLECSVLNVQFSVSGEKGEKLVLKVSDTGVGIAEEHLPHIFDRFYQADDTSTRRGEGTGIGLTLAKELVSLMGGTIGVESEAGKGSLFIVTLPVTQLAAKEPGIRQGQPEIPALAKRHKLQPPPLPSGLPRVLVVEDNADVTAYIRQCLAGEYDLLAAPDGKSGIEMAREEVPDLIVSDVMMPEMDGYELTRSLKGDPLTCHIPIVLLTARADINSRIEGWDQGADEYLAKPFQEQELKARLRNLLETRRKLQEKYLSERKARNQPPRIEDPLVRQVIQLIEKDLMAQWDAESLAATLFVTQKQLYRKLRNVAGMHITEFVRYVRLQNASRLLTEHPDWKVATIAYEVGFGSPQEFSRRFREVFGCSPAQWRE